MCLLCLFLFASIGNTLTPLTPIPVSDVGKSMLSSPSLSVLGDHQQFQTGRLREKDYSSILAGIDQNAF